MWIWVAIVALLTLLFFGSSREGLRGWKTQEDSTDYSGYDIAGSPTKKDVAACSSSCAANSSCVLSVSDVSSGTGNCWLKTKAGTKSTPSNRFARQLSSLADKGSIRCESNPSVLGASNTASVFRFNSNKVANHYPSAEIANFWDPKWDTTDTYVDCAGLTKGSSMTKPSVWTQEMNVNHNGTDLSSESMTTPDKCLTDCINNPACKGTVFNGSKCWLKSTIGTKTASTGNHSYMKSDPPAAAAGWALVPNSDYAGGGLSSLTGSTMQACNDACASNADCKGVVFDTHDDTCYLKKTIGTRTDFNGLHSYLKPMAAPTGWMYEADTNHSGNDIRQIENSTSEACWTACNEDATCKGFLFDTRLTNGAPTNKCYLKNAISAKSVKTGVNSYLKPMAAPAGWTYEANADYAGTDLRKIDNATTEACLDECAKDAACKGFGFDKPSNTCYLASEITTKATSNNFDTYLNPAAVPPIPAPAGWTLVPDSIYAGGDLSNLTGSTMQACNDACSTNADCKGAVFNTLNNTCVLKSSMGDRSVSAGTHSYLKPAAAPAGWTFEADTDHAGNDLRQLENSTPEACWTECNNDPLCKGFGFDARLTGGAPNNKCFLKSDISAKSTLSQFNSYLKPGAALPGWTLEVGTNYSGNDIKNIADSTADACSQACLDMPECVATVFNTTDSKCWIKSSLANKTAQKNTNTYIKPAAVAEDPAAPTVDPPVDPTVDPAAPTEDSTDAPFEPVPAPSGWTLETDVRYEGTYTETPGSNPDDCIASCATTDGCLGLGIDATAVCRKYSSFSETKSTVAGYNTYKNGTPYQSPVTVTPIVDPVVKPVDPAVTPIVDPVIKPSPFKRTPIKPKPSDVPVDYSDYSSTDSSGPVAYNALSTFLGFNF